MTREEADFIGSMNMCDEISNEAYKKIMCHCEEQEQTSWIPVSERLPEDAQTVLVTRACRRNRRRHHFVETGEIIGGTWISPNDEYRIEVDSYTVIAWMPLPEPYNAESEDKE